MTAFKERIVKSLDSLEVAFKEVQKENNPGKIQIVRENGEKLVVKVGQIGDYTFQSNLDSQTMTMQSPQSGIHNYVWDSSNGFWKSNTEVHILEEILVREFLSHSKGMLML